VRRFTIGRCIVVVFLLLFVVSPIYLLHLPYIPALRTGNPSKTTLMQLREKQAKDAGKPLHLYYVWKPIAEISPNLMHALLLSEDDTFYQHNGFDMEQIQIAIKTDWEKKRFAYGGSTLTQQLARSLYLSPRKNLFRKAKEAFITVLLERYLTKNRIMELYLNVVEWGPGVFGAEAASQTYFQKPAKELSPDEAVALVSILPSPRRWSPTSERSFMTRRRSRLYSRMRREGYVPSEPSLPDIPEEIRQMAIQANQFLERQAALENAQPPSPDDQAPPDEDADQNGEGLYLRGQTPPAPQ
jgi:monofunctional glycosyltransferase